MKATQWRILAGVTLTLFLAGCASGLPERIDGSKYDQAQYDMDEERCRLQARKKFPHQTQAGKFTRTPLEIPKTDNRPFIIMEFNSCMRLKGWKNF